MTTDQAVQERAAPESFAWINSGDLTTPPWWDDESVYNMGSLGVFRGRDAIVTHFRSMVAAMPDFAIEVERVLQDGQHTVVQWNATGTFEGAPLQGVEATGHRVRLRGCDVIEWDGDVIRSNTVYSDGMDFARQIGMLPPEDSPGERALRALFNGGTRLRRRFR
jgi:predicted ester cyclase